MEDNCFMRLLDVMIEVADRLRKGGYLTPIDIPLVYLAEIAEALADQGVIFQKDEEEKNA